MILNVHHFLLLQVPEKFHFLEIYEPPEYTNWCHSTPPTSISAAKTFSGDKADMWQFGILSLDLLTNMKLSDTRDSSFSLWHHDVWPFVQGAAAQGLHGIPHGGGVQECVLQQFGLRAVP
ncbi:protein kinase domain-containing protein [Caerostris extrusa]|uniref:Protein kinase domain-containing protein n=1 Tax=Caerostris extrusa TaxID=172846 RepID=A0AAV4MZ40_CAEEX|nr:protein kinase domain-containing protein [Caerostris extrusa]